MATVNALVQLLGVQYPIIQAPMMGICTPELVAAVSNAGGLGSLGCGEKSLDQIQSDTVALRALTDRPFNLNFFATPKINTNQEVLEKARERLRPWYKSLSLGEPPVDLPDAANGFDEAKLLMLLDIKPKVVSFHFGYPNQDQISALKNAGIILLGSATNVAEAEALEVAGFHAIIAQGWEAGGQRGSHVPTIPSDGIGTMALVPQVVDAVSVPVIAAGGIADGRGVAAALALGASGVQMGTAFLRCPEAATPFVWRQYLENASDVDTLVTDSFSGRSARTRRSRYAEEMENNRQLWPPFPQMFSLSGPIRNAAPDDEVSFYPYGQAAALSKELPARQLVEMIVNDTRMAMMKASMWRRLS